MHFPLNHLYRNINTGEVFVLDDGGEVDLDLGNYERFLDITLTKDCNITTGKIYSEVIEQERSGKYLGKTVQVVPHITDAIQNWVLRVSHAPFDSTGVKADVCIIELGGTIGDIESAPFIEALRQFQFKVDPQSFCLVLVSLVPVVGSVGEQKTKPTQSCVRDLRALGLSPDIIACRSSDDLTSNTVCKIANFCHVNSSDVFPVKDCSTVYEVPILLHKRGIVNTLKNKLALDNLNIHNIPPTLSAWKDMCDNFKTLTGNNIITIVGKYTNLKDSYISLIKAIEHASMACNSSIDIVWVESNDLEDSSKASDYDKYKNAWDKIHNTNAVIIPGGFGERGIDGMIAAACWCRLNKVPLFGICLGMQVIAIEFARNVLNISGANSEEFNPKSPDNVVISMHEGTGSKKAETMKLGAYDIVFSADFRQSKLYRLYNKPVIRERFRHKYVLDPKFNSLFSQNGLEALSVDKLNRCANILELNDHPFYVGTQYHPEYITRPLRPSPCFVGIVHAACGTIDKHLFSQNL